MLEQLQSACQAIVDETDGVLACVLVDLDTGLTLVDGRRAGPSLDVEAVARTASVLFRGPFMNRVASALSPRRSPAEYMKQAQVTTAGNHQFLSVLPGRPGTVVVLVTKRSMSIGLGWMAMRLSMDRFEDPVAAPQDHEAAPEARAAGVLRARADGSPELPAPATPQRTPSRDEPGAVVPAAASPGVANATGGGRGLRPVTRPDAGRDIPKGPAEAGRQAAKSKGGARASFRKT